MKFILTKKPANEKSILPEKNISYIQILKQEAELKLSKIKTITYMGIDIPELCLGCNDYDIKTIGCNLWGSCKRNCPILFQQLDEEEK